MLFNFVPYLITLILPEKGGWLCPSCVKNFSIVRIIFHYHKIEKIDAVLLVLRQSNLCLGIGSPLLDNTTISWGGSFLSKSVDNFLLWKLVKFQDDSWLVLPIKTQNVVFLGRWLVLKHGSVLLFSTYLLGHYMWTFKQKAEPFAPSLTFLQIALHI